MDYSPLRSITVIILFLLVVGTAFSLAYTKKDDNRIDCSYRKGEHYVEENTTKEACAASKAQEAKEDAEWREDNRLLEEAAEKLGCRIDYFNTGFCIKGQRRYEWDSDAKKLNELEDSKKCADSYDLPIEKLSLHCANYFGVNVSK